MRAFLATADGWTAATRPAWLWAGQLALVVLGIHLAADQVDDLLHAGLVRLPLPEADPDLALDLSRWGGLALELLGALRAAWILLSSGADPTPRRWGDRARAARREREVGATAADRVEAFSRPLFWAAMALSGAWVVQMAVEDALAGWHPVLATALGWGLAALAAWRLGWTGLRHVSGDLPPRRRRAGWLWAPLTLSLTGLAVWHGLPVWGWR